MPRRKQIPRGPEDCRIKAPLQKTRDADGRERIDCPIRYGADAINQAVLIVRIHPGTGDTTLSIAATRKK
jgi:hypothetical protein